MNSVFKILTQKEWEEFQAARTFKGTELDLKDGYFHTSTKNQVKGVLDRYYQDIEVIVVELNIKPYQDHLKLEKASNGEKYPHLYVSEIHFKNILKTLKTSEF